MPVKKILVIGSNSFSSSSLINLLLKKKYIVYGISRSKLNKKHFLGFDSNNKNFFFKQLDLNKHQNKIINLIKEIKPIHIINFASQSMVGQSWKNPIDWFYTNSFSMIKLYYNISELKFKSKIIHISTPEIYGNIKNKTSENYFYNPTTPYAVSRVTADHFLKILHERKKISYCSVRSSNVYGEHQRLYRIIPKTIYSILKRKKMKLDGGGVSVRNFIHIDDVSNATYKIIKSGKNGEIYHISSKEIISIRNLVKTICKKMNYSFDKLIKHSPERPGKDKYYILSNKKISNDFNWKPKIKLSDGLDKCISWVKENLNFFLEFDENYYHKK